MTPEVLAGRRRLQKLARHRRRIPNLLKIHQDFARGWQNGREGTSDLITYERIDATDPPGIYIDQRHFFPQFPCDPVHYLEVYPEYQVTPAAVRKKVMAGAWLICSVCIDRTMQMSSAIVWICGSRSLIYRPISRTGSRTTTC